MKIAIYSPYLDTFGGGEKYMMTAAEVLSQKGIVDILLDQHLYEVGGDYLKAKLAKRFNLDLSAVNFIKSPMGKGSNFINRCSFLKHYDLLIYLTDGSLFYPTSKKNILHIQSPIIGEPTKGLWGKIKLSKWDIIIYNSQFTKINSEKNWPHKSEVIYPPVDVEHIKPLKKKKYILSVGRFFGFLKDKKHSLLIDAFRGIYNKGSLLKDWSLHLVGSASEGDLAYVKELTDSAKGLPIKFYPNLDYSSLVKLYGESSIYWHAAGFGENDPTKMEHFGISVVEAMSAGCIPVVVNKGGLVEIITDQKSGFLWADLEQLKGITLNLVGDDRLSEDISTSAIQESKRFSIDRFIASVNNLI